MIRHLKKQKTGNGYTENLSPEYTGKDVFHKTFISVDEKGTKAGAATVVALEDGALFLSEPREIYLDRPFIYMLIDCETNSPIFIGVMRDLEL